MKTALRLLLLLLLGSCAACTGASAADFDGSSLLFARLGAAQEEGGAARADSAAPTFERLSAQGRSAGADLQAPLGSVWKLFVYAYALDRAIAMPDYLCRGGKLAVEESYCCHPGQTIARDAALAQSCALFFEPARLRLDAQDWRHYWRDRAPQQAWLADLPALKPQRQVSVAGLLQALASIDGAVRESAQSALLAVMLNGRGRSALPELGGRYRVKTFTWNHPQRSDSVIGGAAGWMSDGSVVWFGALGSSLQVLRDYAPQLAEQAQGVGSQASNARCVDVAMFARYPLRRVSALGQAGALAAGVTQDLRGPHRLEFANGRQLTVQADGALRLQWDEQGRPTLSARLDENEYLARVIDREADAAEPQAARALAVLARSYLLQNATLRGECLSIADSSRTQRVSPNPASAAARDAAAFTAGLVLQGAPAQYRLRTTMKNVLSWQDARAQAKAGMRFDEILQQAFEHAALASVNGHSECRSLPGAERWLLAQARRWRELLQAQPGFAAPRVQVCQLTVGNPYSDMAHQRIYVRGLVSLNDRLALAHEYLHLAFSAHPSGQDEMYVEQWARRLIEGDTRS